MITIGQRSAKLVSKAKTFFEYFDTGYRMMSLNHFMDNDWSGSATGVKKFGLTQAGKEWVKLMLKHGGLEMIDESTHRIGFSCGHSHDILVGLLLAHAIKVRVSALAG